MSLLMCVNSLKQITKNMKKLLLIIFCLFSVSCNKEKSLQKELSLVENKIRELSEHAAIKRSGNIRRNNS